MSEVHHYRRRLDRPGSTAQGYDAHNREHGVSCHLTAAPNFV